MRDDLSDRLKAAYDKCKLFPEAGRNPDGSVTVKGEAWIALLDLRALVPEIQLALHELGELVTVPRMD